MHARGDGHHGERHRGADLVAGGEGGDTGPGRGRGVRRPGGRGITRTTRTTRSGIPGISLINLVSGVGGGVEVTRPGRPVRPGRGL
ncbi:hypothetical protein B446_19365 [Streptomyces collinus Tu 365]|uniref:Uncharacterized protein n=1 Tax=Streptomyces collinus (strain DSM 40733 / Tue 365) TaxID=1214242 RepID=S5VJD5_STRC3|nr:hypothetical protein B446_19365 [Streptomyces collinus Tu 365]